jgi:ankyrin repeat protein
MVLVLLQRGADPNVQTQSGWTALHFAVKNSNKDIAELLRSYGARSDIMNEWMKGLFLFLVLDIFFTFSIFFSLFTAAGDLAREKNDVEMMELLRKPALRSNNAKHQTNNKGKLFFAFLLFV